MNQSPAPGAASVHGEFLGHPRPLFTLFFAEGWERFSYYGMRALLTLFMTLPAASAGFGYTVEKASLIYGTYVFSVYMMSIPGGSIADNILGARMAVIIGGLFIACGHFSMAFPSEATFYLGLLLVVIGTGLLKPNISAMVGQLYAPNDTRRDAGFSITQVIGPLDSVINMAPYNQDSLQRKLARRVGWRVPGVSALISGLFRIPGAWPLTRMAMSLADNRPGRLYSFIADRP